LGAPNRQKLQDTSPLNSANPDSVRCFGACFFCDVTCILSLPSSNKPRRHAAISETQKGADVGRTSFSVLVVVNDPI